MEEVARLLQVPGIDTNTKNKEGKTALQLAYANNREMVVDLLNIFNGMLDVNKTSETGNTLLHWVTAHNYMQTVKVLLSIDGINVNTKNKQGNTPLCLAVSNGHIEVLFDLLEKNHGIDVNAKNESGFTPLHIVANEGHIEIAARLLQSPKIDPNINSKDGKTSLQLAKTQGHLAIVNLLNLFTKTKHNVNAKTEMGNTFLHWAAYNGYLEVVKVLLKVDGVDACVKNRDSFTPCYYAQYMGRIEIADLLNAFLEPKKSNQKLVYAPLFPENMSYLAMDEQLRAWSKKQKQHCFPINLY